jgi:hypothetical protein
MEEKRMHTQRGTSAMTKDNTITIDSGWSPEIRLELSTSRGKSVSMTVEEWEQFKRNGDVVVDFCTRKFYEQNKQKPSAFVDEMGSHAIYQVEDAVADFAMKTGITLDPAPSGFTMTLKEAQSIIETGGHVLPESIGKQMISGYAFALIVCERLGVDSSNPYSGRGRQHRVCVEALQKAGK